MIAGPDDVTAAVLSEVERAKNHGLLCRDDWYRLPERSHGS